MSATETLNSLLRGELAATETYQQARSKLSGTPGAPDLERVHREHTQAAQALRQHVRAHGGQPEASSGAWGTFASAVEGTAKALGTDATLKALKEGEEMGAKNYEDALHEGELPADCQELIRDQLLPQTRSHVPVLDRLMAGLVERISPQDARQQLDSDADAMLICAYDDEAKCQSNHLSGAISLADFQAREDALPKTTRLIFYCA